MKLLDSKGANVKGRRRRLRRRSNPTSLLSKERGREGDVLASMPREFDGALSLTAKRTADLTIAATVGLISLPILGVIALLIKCLSRGPVFYSQVRLGKNGKPFRILKFRTMVEDAEDRLHEYLSDDPEYGEQWSTGFKLRDDPRVIPWIGHWLRLSSVDELPQLWNVLSGDMSLVGPRPLPPYHLERFEEEFLRLRESMRPGITGQWQIRSRNNGAPEMFRKWDTYYVLNWSLWLDLKILASTPWVVFSGAPRRTSPAEGAGVRNS